MLATERGSPGTLVTQNLNLSSLSHLRVKENLSIAILWGKKGRNRSRISVTLSKVSTHSTEFTDFIGKVLLLRSTDTEVSFLYQVVFLKQQIRRRQMHIQRQRNTIHKSGRETLGAPHSIRQIYKSLNYFAVKNIQKYSFQHLSWGPK